MSSHLLQVGEGAVAVTPAGLTFLGPSMLSHHPFRRGVALWLTANGRGGLCEFSS
jgi:hypothetical protein